LVIAFLDASALIYLVDGDEDSSGAVQQALQELAAADPSLAIAVSRLSVLECRVGPLRRGDQASLERFDALFAQPDLLWVELTAPVVEQATRLRALHGVRTPDALQAACCLQLGSDAVMVSGDADFRRIPTLQLRLLS
jgi:predicted nucleic acid-binding protein